MATNAETVKKLDRNKNVKNANFIGNIDSFNIPETKNNFILLLYIAYGAIYSIDLRFASHLTTIMRSVKQNSFCQNGRVFVEG